MFAKRLTQPELLDHASPEEARPNLNDLIRINRNFGGHSTILKTLAGVIEPRSSFSLLDVGAASGDTARVVQARYPGAAIVNLDYNCTNLHGAPMPKVISNALTLPFAPLSFDYVLCSSFLHHFQDEQIVELLRSFYAVARKAVFVCDLERSIFPYLFLPATQPLFKWGRLTVHDGRISVRAAFRKKELLELSRRAGIPAAKISAHRPAFRLAMIARKPAQMGGPPGGIAPTR